MYKEKLEPILKDLENKELEIAGGAVVGIVLSTVNSLIKYISNLTLGKKKYEDVQEDIEDILEKAEQLKKETLDVIDKDREILEEILKAYKTRKENETRYLEVCKESVEFCMDVVRKAYETIELADTISKVGNKMLASDFKICKYYAFASVKSAIVNVDINLESINDEIYKKKIVQEYNEILEKSRRYI